MWTRQIAVTPRPNDMYIGSPSIAKLNDGTLVASHDWFGAGAPRNIVGSLNRSEVYRSTDDGVSWRHAASITDMWWGTLFVSAGALYLLGVSAEYESIVIRKSEDGGVTWTGNTVVAPGGAGGIPPNYTCSPGPICRKDGYIFKAYENNTVNGASWPDGFASLVVYCRESDDLMQTANWRVTANTPFSPAWLPSEWGAVKPGYLEGNIVEAPDGSLKNILRLDAPPGPPNKAIMLDCDWNPATPSLSQSFGQIIDLPGGNVKFTIRRDPVSGLYLSLVNLNNNTVGFYNQRNVLALVQSPDLMEWTTASTVIEAPGYDTLASIQAIGFQYVDWNFDGHDILAAVRTAWKTSLGPTPHHDANRLTFVRLHDYQSLLAT